jgi:Flp pilus assembly protein TadD
MAVGRDGSPSRPNPNGAARAAVAPYLENKLDGAAADNGRSTFRVNQRRLIPLLIIVAGLWAWHNSFRGPFIFDDVTSIAENPHIRHLWPIGEAMKTSPTLAVQGRPVECLTLALNYALGGLNVWGYHAFNLALHVTCALVLFAILRRTFEGTSLRDRFGAEAPWLAAAIALIWEVHPLQTESVTYIVQRSELLMGLFLLLTLYCVIRSEGAANPRDWQWLAIVSCALGMGCKEVMVVAPLIVLLYDRVFLASTFRELWRRRGAVYVGLALTWLILAGLVVVTTHEMTGLGMQEVALLDYLRTEAGVILHYLRLCFWPRPQVIDYFDWPVSRSWNDCVIPGALVVALLGATLWAFRWRPWLGFLGAWFFLILAPTSSVLPSFGEVAAERRMYLPLAAVVTLVIGGGWRTLTGLLRHRLDARNMGGGAADRQSGCRASASVAVVHTPMNNNVALRWMGGAALAAAVLALGWMTIRRNEDYRSDVSIWSDVIAHRPHNTRALVNLGTVLARRGQTDEALDLYRQALQIDPGNSDAQYNLGLTLAGRNELDEALVHLNEAVRLVPHSAVAQRDLGVVLAQKGDLIGASKHLTESLRFAPRNATAHNVLGTVLARQGNLAEAVKEFARALQSEPDLADAHANLGLALAQLGHMEQAVQQWETAVGLDPKQENARRALDQVHSNGQ